MSSANFKSGPNRSDLPIDLDPGEAELLDSFDRWIHTAHPNPERTGCPGKSALMALALVAGRFEDEHTLMHLAQCAACLDDLKQIRRELVSVDPSL